MQGLFCGAEGSAIFLTLSTKYFGIFFFRFEHFSTFAKFSEVFHHTLATPTPKNPLDEI